MPHMQFDFQEFNDTIIQTIRHAASQIADFDEGAMSANPRPSPAGSADTMSTASITTRTSTSTWSTASSPAARKPAPPVGAATPSAAKSPVPATPC